METGEVSIYEEINDFLTGIRIGLGQQFSHHILIMSEGAKLARFERELIYMYMINTQLF